MKIQMFILLIALLCGTTFVEAKRYMRCELTKELIQKYQFSKTFLSNWICMIEHESGLDTRKVTKKPNGSVSYGLFQISSKEWCREGRNAGLCKKKCEHFKDENIEDDVACAKLIFDRDGFKHWAGWNQTCRNPQNLPNLEISCRISNF